MAVREFAKRTGLQVSLDLQAVERVNAERARSGELPTVLFRIVQESLTNIARHARAENVEIHLIDDGRNLVLTVSDDGQGMADGREPGGFGLVSMRERAASLGGNFAIISGVGLGTTIQVELSLALPIFAGAPSLGFGFRLGGGRLRPGAGRVHVGVGEVFQHFMGITPTVPASGADVGA